ncbi:antibiotic biosynthesis monooxygenase [Actibacterium mucosum KCTC 23349]|uniref:Antibiotic biosynthesis monooxygenase n=1 Tax=Actibacterium mucosum KCTC 23349 TaxID=1454373 RepID=A0A037ZDJ6_9RHOB|nr:antibiotic biosynthesis monooxygenase [Actibacterium mucosum]KAJ54549.1 antibiotic biosynthesis monooxygenase [Actibacterium mucosum KCTC 23349]
MITVIFELTPGEGQKDAYLGHAADLKPLLEKVPGFISVERFQSLTTPEKLLSLSFWESEEAVIAWRNTAEHRAAQSAARGGVLAGYRLRVAQVLRDYGHAIRGDVPEDSRDVHDI